MQIRSALVAIATYLEHFLIFAAASGAGTFFGQRGGAENIK